MLSRGESEGIINVNPLTHLIVRTSYNLDGKKAEDAFTVQDFSIGEIGVEDLGVVKKLVNDELQSWMLDKGLDPKTFDPFTTGFLADGTGFDGLLDILTVDDSSGTITAVNEQVTQTSMVTADSGSRVVTVQTTTTVNPVVTAGAPIARFATTTATSTSHVVMVPIEKMTAEVQAALDGVNATLAELANITLTKGKDLVWEDIMHLYHSDFLNDNMRASQDGKYYTADHREAVAVEFLATSARSFDQTNGVIEVLISRKITYGTETIAFDYPGILKKTVDGAGIEKWLWYGNQAAIMADFEMQWHCDWTSAGRNCFQRAHIKAEAEQGAYETMTITVPGVFTDEPMNKTTGSYDFGSPPDTVESKPQDGFSVISDTGYPAAGTKRTLTATPPASAADTTPYVYENIVEAVTTETINIISPTGHTLADANLGSPTVMKWESPKTFPVVFITLEAWISSDAGNIAVKPEVQPNPFSTSSTITFPDTVNGSATTRVEIYFKFDGIFGEIIENRYIFQ